MHFFILGAPNGPTGQLSKISLGRINLAISLIQESLAHGETSLVSATGGFGPHFNQSPRPHYEIVHSELLALGVKETVIIDGQLNSSNTVEDAILISAFCEQRVIDELTIVTNDFHHHRCQLIFNAIMPDRRVSLLSAPDPDSVDKLVYQHEIRAIAKLEKQGGIHWGSQFFPINQN